MSRTSLAMGLEGPKSTTSRAMRRRLGFQRAQWWRDLQTLFVVAGDKKGHASELAYPCSALRLPLGQDDARVFIATKAHCGLEPGAGGDALDLDSGLALEAVTCPHFGKIHPNLDDLLLHQPTTAITAEPECGDLDLDALGVGVEDVSDCSSDCCSSSAESCCSSSSCSLGDCSDSDSDATDTGGPRRQARSRSRSGSRLWSCLLKVKVNEVRRVGKDTRGDVYVTVLSPPPPPKALVELSL